MESKESRNIRETQPLPPQDVIQSLGTREFRNQLAASSRPIDIQHLSQLTHRSRTEDSISASKGSTLDIQRRTDAISIVDLTQEDFAEGGNDEDRDDDEDEDEDDEAPFIRYRKARRLDDEGSASPNLKDLERRTFSVEGTQKPTLNDYSSWQPSPLHTIQKRGRGRPRKSPKIDQPVASSPVHASTKRGRGRPRKHPLEFHEQTGHLQTKPKQSLLSPAELARIEDAYKVKTNKWMESHNTSHFIERLLQLRGPPVTVSNDLDESGPPPDFELIEDNVFGEGTVKPDPEARSGCTCRPENGRSIGCEYRYCSCLEDVAVNDEGKPVGFPYHAVGDRKGCLRNLYLEQRYAIYECNELCTCPPNCRTKVVQKGRQVPLEIFKTKDRGWGLRSPVPIRKGQFVDTYRGEIITDSEATRRETLAIDGDALTRTKESYLFSLDKFRGVEGSYDFIPDAELYVIDGQFIGGPTRFINHSCIPNLRQFTVSFYRGNPKVYELAFFAVSDIEPFTELTFDYLDLDVEESDDEDEAKGMERSIVKGKESIAMAEKEKGVIATKCLCGAPNCRGYLW